MGCCTVEWRSCEVVMIEIEYPFTIRPLTEAEGGGYLIEYPDLPGCMSDGETVEEAIANGAQSKAAWIAALRDAGRPVPVAAGWHGQHAGRDGYGALSPWQAAPVAV
jgi:predicted RNase H-like HicB family nuclease